MNAITKNRRIGFHNYILFTLAFFLCLHSEAQNSFAITGNISDEKNQPLSGVTIFLTGRMNITASDVNGHFSLNNLSAGNYNLVITMIGHKPLVNDVTIIDKDVVLTFELEPQVINLRAVTITPDKSRLKNLETFKKQFLGESENASQCKILNSEVLTFNYDKKTERLTAISDDILVIKNRALGYQLKYVLLNFTHDENKNSTIYQGYPSFEKMQGSPEEEAQWKNNRRMAYLGSIHHFIHSVYDESCQADGFIVYKIKNRSPFDLTNTNRNLIRIDYNRVSFDSLLTVKDNHFKTLNFTDALYVIYTKGIEQINFKNKNYSLEGVYSERRLPQGQVSIVNLLGPVSIDQNGLFIPTANLYFEGYMGWGKIADLVPYEIQSGGRELIHNPSNLNFFLELSLVRSFKNLKRLLFGGLIIFFFYGCDCFCEVNIIIPTFIGFSKSQIDTVILRRFIPGENFAKMIDSIIIADPSLDTNCCSAFIYSRMGDTTLIFNRYDTIADIRAGYDLAIYIPNTRLDN